MKTQNFIITVLLITLFSLFVTGVYFITHVPLLTTNENNKTDYNYYNHQRIGTENICPTNEHNGGGIIYHN